MLISKVETYLLQIPFRDAFDAASGFDSQKTWNIMLVKVVTDDGVVGWGEPFGVYLCQATKAVIELYLAPQCIGRDPLDRQTLMHDLAYKIHNGGRNGPPVFALSGIEIALWDIAAKVKQMPLWSLLGPESRTRLPAYASLRPLGNGRDVARAAQSALQDGYSHIKLHEKTEETIAAAREAAGEDAAIMVDTNCVWSSRQALAMAGRFEAYDLLWLEEPVWPPEDYDALAEVRREAKIPIAAGENIGTVEGFRRLLNAGAVDYVQPSITKCGGIGALTRVIDMAGSMNIKTVPHSFYFGPGFLATIHVLASAKDDTLLERVYCELEADLYGGRLAVSDGVAAVPDGPGLGIDPDLDVIKSYRAA